MTQKFEPTSCASPIRMPRTERFFSGPRGAVPFPDHPRNHSPAALMSNVVSFPNLPSQPSREADVPEQLVIPIRPLEQLDDGSLLQAVVDGRPRAATVFFDRYSANVERHLRRMLGP